MLPPSYITVDLVHCRPNFKMVYGDFVRCGMVKECSSVNVTLHVYLIFFGPAKKYDKKSSFCYKNSLVTEQCKFWDGILV